MAKDKKLDKRKYGVVYLGKGGLDGEYRFRTKGNKDENGWTVAARNLKEAYEKADKIPEDLRS